ncbi:hypothetical protein ANCDUO_20542, partial [Ancylostoma duodenale]
YILCVSAEHNYGLAAMSKSIRFRTKRWWADDDSACLQLPFTNRRLSIASVLSSLSALRRIRKVEVRTGIHDEPQHPIDENKDVGPIHLPVKSEQMYQI